MFGKKKLTDQENLYLDVITAMVKREDTIIEINPKTMNYLLSLEKEQYYISVDSLGVKIANHDFTVSRHFDSHVLDAMKAVLEEETAKRREEKEKLIFNNENALLLKIKDYICKK